MSEGTEFKVEMKDFDVKDANYKISYGSPNDEYKDGFADGYSRGWQECWNYMREELARQESETKPQEREP